MKLPFHLETSPVVYAFTKSGIFNYDYNGI